jgi:protein CpxP
MIKTAAVTAFVAAVAVAAYTTVEGQGRRGGFGGPPPMGGPGPMGGGRGGPLGELRALDLTDAQRQQVKEVMDQHRNATQPLHDKAMTVRQALREAIEADTIDDNTIRQRSAAVAAVDADLAVAEAHLHQSVMAVLTAEQQQKLRELRAQAQERMKARQQNRQSQMHDLRERVRERLVERFGAAR